MSKTIVDMPKVTQMLDAGWEVRLFKNAMGSYSAIGRHNNEGMVNRVHERIIAQYPPNLRGVVGDNLDDNEIDTDDFTPEQALTRLAYKCHGEILTS